MRRRIPPIGKKWLHSAGGLLIPFYVCLSIVFLETVLRLQVRDIPAGTGWFSGILFSLTLGLGASALIALSGGRLRNALTAAFLGFLTAVFISQFIYFEIFQTFYSLYSAAKGGQVAQFYLDILYVMGCNVPWLLLMALPFAGYFFLPRRFRPGQPSRPRACLGFALCAALLFAAALLPIRFGSRDTNSPYDLYYRNSYPVYSVMDFGLLTTMRLDLQRSVFGMETEEELPVSGGGGSASESLGTGSSLSASSGQDPSPSASPDAQDEYNIMDIDFAALAASDNDEGLRAMDTYFASAVPTRKNSHTGMFKGYNLILITAESFSSYAVDRDLTPTLYHMAVSGFRFTEFYNPLWGVSTSDGEYVAMTGLIPKSGVWSMLLSADDFMPFAMGSRLSVLGYATYAYHDHYYDYYGRDKSHPNLGYNVYKGIGNGLKLTKQWPRSDLEMMQATIPEYIGSQPFHTYYMTVSGHLSYNFFGNQMAVKNKALVDSLPFVEHARAYLATQIEFDRAMEYLLDALDKAGVAERTLIAISADHYPYGLRKEEIDNLAGHAVESNFELYKSTWILYAKGMQPETIDRPVSSLDILPTLSNLLGVEYDSRLLMGTDAFSDTPPLVIFCNRSFISDKGRYNALTKAFTPAAGAGEPGEGYVDGILDAVGKKFHYSARILETDYYRHAVR